MAKVIVDTEVIDKMIKAYGCGELTRHIFNEVLKQGQELVYCEDCDMSRPPISPFDKNYVRCLYLASGDGKYVCRNGYCSSGERRSNNACK